MTQRKRIKNPKIRLWLALTIPFSALFFGTIFIPGAWAWWAIFGGAVAVVLGLIALVCSTIALVYWVRTGYITNPFRHGPWGDWKPYGERISWP